MTDGYAVSCSCGWTGGLHESADRAERKARDHEGRSDQPKAKPTKAQIDEWLDRR